jgi:membrane protease subunit HflK
MRIAAVPGALRATAVPGTAAAGRATPGDSLRAARTPGAGGNVSSLDDFLKRSRERFGGRFPHQEGRPYWLYGLGVFVLLWLVFTCFHIVGPQERGVVTLFGKYSRTVNSGIAMTLPSPIERLQKVDVGRSATPMSVRPTPHRRI